MIMVQLSVLVSPKAEQISKAIQNWGKHLNSAQCDLCTAVASCWKSLV